MKLTAFIFGLGMAALAVAGAAESHEVILSSPTWVGNTQLKPGTYKVAVQGGMAVFSAGKTVAAEAPATEEKTDRKASATEVGTDDSKIKEIRLGGTNTRLVFKPVAPGDAAAH